MYQQLSNRVTSKSVKNAINNRMVEDFNLYPFLAEAYFNQVKYYFLEHTDPGLQPIAINLIFSVWRSGGSSNIHHFERILEGGAKCNSRGYSIVLVVSWIVYGMQPSSEYTQSTYSPGSVIL